MPQAELNPIQTLTKDLKSAARTLSDQEARFLVDAYYIMQEDRKRSFNQERSLETSGEPNAIIGWLANQSQSLEAQIKRALDQYTEAHPMGSWMREVYGIGPVISAGFLAHIDIERAPTVGHIWQYAGIAGDGQKPWEKGKKRPFNAGLKTLCWKAGQSFLKLSNHEDCYYGQLYRQRKEYETAKNLAGDYKALAEASAKRVKPTTETYKHNIEGRLSPGHIDARARRWAVKLFLAHLHQVWYEKHFGKPAPLPYPIAHLGHVHYLAPPN